MQWDFREDQQRQSLFSKGNTTTQNERHNATVRLNVRNIDSFSSSVRSLGSNAKIGWSNVRNIKSFSSSLRSLASWCSIWKKRERPRRNSSGYVHYIALRCEYAMRQRNIAQNMYNVRRKSFRSFGPTVALCLSFCVVVLPFEKRLCCCWPSLKSPCTTYSAAHYPKMPLKVQKVVQL